MADLIATARAISYTDFRRRVMKAYTSHAAGKDPALDGDPRIEDKLGAYLAQFGEFKFAWFVRFLVDDTPYSHAGRLDLADYCIYLRGLHYADHVTPLSMPDYTPFSVPTTHAMNVEAA
ncbi:hypothetical protein [Arthrobacter sp. MDT1-65]